MFIFLLSFLVNCSMNPQIYFLQSLVSFRFLFWKLLSQQLWLLSIKNLMATIFHAIKSTRKDVFFLKHMLVDIHVKYIRFVVNGIKHATAPVCSLKYVSKLCCLSQNNRFIFMPIDSMINRFQWIDEWKQHFTVLTRPLYWSWPICLPPASQQWTIKTQQQKQTDIHLLMWIHYYTVDDSSQEYNKHRSCWLHVRWA